jgi:hypothetical protein
MRLGAGLMARKENVEDHYPEWEDEDEQEVVSPE